MRAALRDLSAQMPGRRGARARGYELLQVGGGATIAYRRRPSTAASTLTPRGSAESAGRGIWSQKASRDSGAGRPLRARRGAAREGAEPADDGTWSRRPTSHAGADDPGAAGTQPNTIAARRPEHFQSRRSIFPGVDESGHPYGRRSRSRSRTRTVLLSGGPAGPGTSYFGDVHPSFFGNVVKAMGSASRVSAGEPRAERIAPASGENDAESWKLNGALRATVKRSRVSQRRSSKSSCVPLAARAFSRGSSTGCRTSKRARRYRQALDSRWKGSRSRVRGWGREAGLISTSCSRWAVRQIYARCSSRVSPSC